MPMLPQLLSVNSIQKGLFCIALLNAIICNIKKKYLSKLKELVKFSMLKFKESIEHKKDKFCSSVWYWVKPLNPGSLPNVFSLP